MPNNYGPRLVTDGLVLCLDAGNSKSYPGSGTAWNDLSRNGNNGTLNGQRLIAQIGEVLCLMALMIMFQLIILNPHILQLRHLLGTLG